MWFALVLPALAVPDGDFEAGGGDWIDVSEWCFNPLDGLPPFCSPYPYGFSVDGTWARGTTAGHLALETGEPYAPYGGDVFVAESADFVVTHDRLGWAQYPASQGVVTLVAGAGSRVPGPVSPDAMTQYERDVSAQCGLVTRVRLEGSQFAELWFDDIALSGAVCPEFADGDGDGLCPRGQDLDADGACLGAEIDVASDCDDLDPGVGACLTMTFDRWIEVDRRHAFRVSGLPAGGTVRLVASASLGAACPAPLGGACTDLAEPVVPIAVGVAGPDGVAALRPVVTGLQAMSLVWVQAVAVPGGARTPPVQAGLLPAPTGPHARRGGVFNGDLERGEVTGWSPFSAGFEFDPYGYNTMACPGPELVASPARGAWALSIGDVDDPARAMCEGRALGWPSLVTHELLGWADLGAGRVDVTRLDGTVVAPVDLGLVAEDGFSETVRDVSAACGERVWLDLSVADPGPQTVFDQFALRGPVCEVFLDRDGDGRCPQGVDTDGDGACVARGEPREVRGDLPVLVPWLDFESDPDALDDADLAPHHAWGDRSRAIDPYAVFDMAYLPTGTVVTHRTLLVRATASGSGDWTGGVLQFAFGWSDTVDGDVRASAGPGRWVQHQLDVSGMCVEEVDYLSVDAFGRSDWDIDVAGASPFFHTDVLLYDDVGLGGEPCAELVDTDGDSACSLGVDIDGDGLCVGPGEPTPGVVQDADE